MAKHSICCKIRLEDPQYLTNWNHQGVLSYVQKQLKSIVADDGVLCISTLQELVLRKKILEEPWIGFVHDVPQNNLLNYPDLEHMVIDECFVKSLPYCQGLFAMSHVVQEYLKQKLEEKIPVAKICYPITPLPDNKIFNWTFFDLSSKVLSLPTFFQNCQAIYNLRVPADYQKILLKPPHDDFKQLKKDEVTLAINGSVFIKDSLTDEEYDDLLRSSIVFLNLYDSTISTTVIECIGRNTPLVVNRLPGLEEYLGVDYPLFYDTIEEAADIMHDKDKLIAATTYLKSLPMKAELTGDQFLNSFINTAIYRYLPLPPSQQNNPQQTHFPWFDVSVSICSYKRVYNLKHLLDCFNNQDFTGTFEVILWNNNHETQQEVASIAAPFMKKLNIRLIQSTENYYCIIRLAVANLMRSDLLLVCDDDVVPKPNYISGFIAKYNEYGPRTVLCYRGKAFTIHKMNEEKPEEFWDDPNDGYCKKMFEQEHPDRQVQTYVLAYRLLCINYYRSIFCMLVPASFQERSSLKPVHTNCLVWILS